jgi:cold shock CspA family protein
MADTYNKKEREKRREQKKKEKAARKELRKESGKKGDEIAYVDYDGNFTENKPVHFEPEFDVSEIQTSTPKSEKSTKKVGSMKFFNAEKKYGFIKCGGKIGEIYFSVKEDSDNFAVDDKVEFEIGQSEKGPYAFNVTKVA